MVDTASPKGHMLAGRCVHVDFGPQSFPVETYRHKTHLILHSVKILLLTIANKKQNGFVSNNSCIRRVDAWLYDPHPCKSSLSPPTCGLFVLRSQNWIYLVCAQVSIKIKLLRVFFAPLERRNHEKVVISITMPLGLHAPAYGKGKLTWVWTR